MTMPDAAPAPLPARRVIERDRLALRPFDRYGKAQPGVWWHPITDNRETGEATYYSRYEPGAASSPHEHPMVEEFLVVEGEFVDHDGRVFKAGDFVSYQPGTKHWSHSPKGCLLLVFLRCLNRRLEEGEAVDSFAG